MGIILWILLGALAGWIASKIMGTDAEQGAVANIVVGILGAFVGGWVMKLLGGNGADLGTIDLYSVLVAIGGAVLLLFLYRLVARR
jgi:uncharacterized membrane protein YeaQ/YmgE (transglycosylase-associated protein family)